MRALRLYTALLAPRHVRVAFAASVLGRFPSGMISVALLLLLERRTHSYGVAGLAVAAYNTSYSTVAPLMGRLVDRLGARRVLRGGAAAQLAATAGLLTVAGASSVSWQLVLCSAVAGASFPPPTTAAMRALWPRLVAAADQATACSLEAVVTEIVFVVGPLLVGALTLLASPGVAFGVAASFSACGALTLAVAYPPHEPAVGRPDQVRHWAGPLARPSFRALMPITVCSAVALGLIEIAATAQATAAGNPALAGILLTAVACGSLLGGLWYGGRSSSPDPARQYGWLLAAFSLCLVPPIFAGSIAVLTALLTLTGLAIAPLGSVQGQLVLAAASSEVRTEAFAWINMGNFAGFSLGIAGGGALIELGGGGLPFAAAAAAAAAGAVLAARARGRSSRVLAAST